MNSALARSKSRISTEPAGAARLACLGQGDLHVLAWIAVGDDRNGRVGDEQRLAQTIPGGREMLRLQFRSRILYSDSSGAAGSSACLVLTLALRALFIKLPAAG
jgi:hypothetical protein